MMGLPAGFLPFRLDPKVIHFCVSAALFGPLDRPGLDYFPRFLLNCPRKCTAAHRIVQLDPLHFPKGIFEIGLELVDRR
jgi:hypothetical protein